MKFNILFCFTVVNIVNGLVDTNMTPFFLDVLANKNVKFVQVYSCFSSKEQIQMMKVFSQNNIRSSFTSRLVHSNLNPFYFILDVSCKYSTSILKKFEKLDYFRSHYKWLLFDTTRSILTNTSDIAKVLSDIQLRLDSEVLVTVQNDDTSIVLLYDVYATGRNQDSAKQVVEFGVWTATTQLIVKNHLSKYNTRKDLTGAFVRCATVNVKRFFNKSMDSYYRDATDKGVDTGNKFHYVLFMYLQEIHNFSYNFTLTREWFGILPGGMDAGLGKLFYEDAVDVGTTAALIKSDRVSNYDFTFPTYTLRTSFIFLNSRLSGTVHNEFLRPFASTLWYTVLIAIVLSCVVLKLSFTFGHSVLGDSSETWHSTLLLTWGVICQQGASFVPQLSSGKCGLITMLTMSLLLYNYYTSSIVSSLLSSLPPPIKTIDQLTNSKLRVGLEDTPYVKTFFATTNDPSVQRLHKTKVLSNNEPSYVPVKYGLEKVQKGGYAYHAEAHISYSVIEKDFKPHEICQLAEINLFSTTVVWVVSKKNSEYTKMFAIGYNQMLHAGIMKRQQLIWIVRKPSCLANTHLVGVDFDHLLSAFLVLGFGCGVALLVLLTETYVYKMIKFTPTRSKLFHRHSRQTQ